MGISAIVVLVVGMVLGLLVGDESYSALHPFEMSRNLIYVLLITICIRILNFERHSKEKYIWLCLAGAATLNTMGSLVISVFSTTTVSKQIITTTSSLIFLFAYLSLILGLILVVVSLQKQKRDRPSTMNGLLLIVIFVTLVISFLFVPVLKTSHLPVIEKTIYSVYLGFDTIIIIISILIFSLLSKKQTLREKLSVYDYICFGMIILACYHIFIFFNLFTGNEIHTSFNILRIAVATLWTIGCDIKLQEVSSDSQ